MGSRIAEVARTRPDLVMQVGRMLSDNSGYVAGQLELTSACEQRCTNCQSWIDHRQGTQRGAWSLEEMCGFLNDLHDLPNFETLALTGGDPLSWEPLADLLEWFVHRRTYSGFKYGLRMNTAFPRDITPREGQLWRSAFRDVRISLDGVTPETYKRMRGVDQDPEEIIRRMELLEHPQLSTLTCVSQRNIDEIPAIVARLARYRTYFPFRKAIFIPVRDMNDRALLQIDIRPEDFQRKWEHLQAAYGSYEWTSFGEQVGEGELTQHKGVTCSVGRITFHVKMDGSLYPCCLMGGEAIATRSEFQIGNVKEQHIGYLGAKYRDNPVRNAYDNPSSPCSKICLWKQSSMNLMAHEAQSYKLSMP